MGSKFLINKLPPCLKIMKIMFQAILSSSLTGCFTHIEKDAKEHSVLPTRRTSIEQEYFNNMLRSSGWVRTVRFMSGKSLSLKNLLIGILSYNLLQEVTGIKNRENWKVCGNGGTELQPKYARREKYTEG